MTSVTDAPAGAEVAQSDLRPGGWREQKKRLTRAALHDAARERVLERGLADATVEEICAAAGVSPRTFFNYFPSKAAAAVGLPDLTIGEEARARFLAGDGNPVRDLCRLLADVIGDTDVPDKSSVHELLVARPEVRRELTGWLAEVRRGLTDLAAERLPAGTARLALALVMTALGDAMESDADTDAPLADRLWERLVRMAALVGA